MSYIKTILLIDDEKTFVEALKFQLEAKKGYAVITAHNGLEGLEKLKSIKPDVIILDINMPVMGGIEFCENICDDDGKTKYPVLVLTARANLEQLFTELQVDGFISKPFEFDELLTKVEDILAKKEERIPLRKKVTTEHHSKRVLIVEEDEERLNKIAIAFLSGGYIVEVAKSGMEAFDEVMAELPDVILIRLGLSDLSGDLIAVKLRQISKTKDIPLVLYSTKDDDSGYAVAKKICSEAGIKKIIRTEDPVVLLREVEDVLKQ
ncbi:MAG: response regulator [Candidatus Omnitrophota bacterium]